MLQDQDIKGFTLLELLVVVALISIITAIGIPNFSSWKKDREVRVASEKIASVLSGVNAQTKRKINIEIFTLIIRGSHRRDDETNNFFACGF